MSRLAVLVFIMLCFCRLSESQFESRDSLQALEEFVRGSTKKTIPPLSGNETTVNITLSYYPIAILDLDSAKEVLSVSSFLLLTWRDEKLQWNRSDYHDHKIVEVDPKDIWTPKIAITEDTVDVQPLSSQLPVMVEDDGEMAWHLTGVFHTRCKIDVQDYPFDYQQCHITFVPAHGYPVNIAKSDKFIDDLNIFQKNGEWTLIKTEYNLVNILGTDEHKAGKFTLTLKREPVYFIINIIFPMVLLLLMNPFVFLIPARSGEKLSFLMAIFVSHALFLNLIHQSMPPTSDTVSVLAAFLALIEVQGFLTILATIAILCVHHRKEKSNEMLSQKNIQRDHGRENKEHLIEVKKGNRFGGCCANTSLEQFLDGICFVLSLALSITGCFMMLNYMV